MKTSTKILFAVALSSKASVSQAALTPFDPTAIPDSNLRELIQAGSPTGSPPDSPANRVDPNVPTSFLAGVGSIFIDAHLPGGAGYFGSGTPISRWQILTAAHLFDRDNKPSMSPPVTFLFSQIITATIPTPRSLAV